MKYVGVAPLEEMIAGNDRERTGSTAADYLVFSRAPWEGSALFDGVVDAARWMRDPMSPPFQVNLQWGLRYLHLAVIMPLQQLGLDPRAISIDFAPAPSVKKPGKKGHRSNERTIRVELLAISH